MWTTQRCCHLVALSCLLTATACTDEDHFIQLTTPDAELVVRLVEDGRVDLLDRDWTMLLRGGWAEALVLRDGVESTVSTRGCAGSWEDESLAAEQPYFAELVGRTYACRVDEVSLRWWVALDAAHDTVVTQLTVEPDAALTVLRLTPMITEGPDGGLFVGTRPERHRILDNGSYVAADVDVHVHYPEAPRLVIVDGLFPFAGRGDVLSNWNHAIKDLDSSRSWIAGSLTVERAFPTFGTVFDPDTAPSHRGRRGFNAFYADDALIFDGKRAEPGAPVSSEVTYLDPMAPDPLTGLEDYADAVASWLDFTVWTQRDGGRPVPNGWNSWSGSGSTGGLGTDIDEQILAENLEVMAREFEPFGIDYFQIDDGYQIADGDWLAREDRFPAGMEAFSEQIVDADLIPGIWISGFTVADDSQLASEHPEWLAHEEDNAMRSLLDPDEGESALDLSNDEVIAWISETMRRYKDDWQMGWVKLDFGYIAFPYRPRARPELTAMEAYKRGIRAYRDALGDDVFYMGIGLMGVNYGVVDAMRTTLDTGPHWEEGLGFNIFGEGGSFKAGVKAGSRRYYLHDRVWVNHHDLMFFRTDASRPEEVVTLEEATTFASFIGLSGAIVKFGEDLRTLEEEQIQVWRKLLPTYPTAARPLDLFERQYPEIYHLPIRGTLAGADAEWTVLGLLNWGRNYDFEVEPGAAEMKDAARRYAVELASLGLDPDQEYLASEFWSQSFLGRVTGSLEHEVAAHGHAVIALREVTGHPQLLGHNRHLTQGATDLIEERWDEGERELRLVLAVDAGGQDAVPFEYRIRVYVPPDWELTSAEIGDAQLEEGAEVTEIRFTPSEPGTFEAVLQF